MIVSFNSDHLLVLRKTLCTFLATELHNKYMKIGDYPYQIVAYACTCCFLNFDYIRFELKQSAKQK